MDINPDQGADNDNWCIDMDNDNWLTDIYRDLSVLRLPSGAYTISKVRDKLRNEKNDAYSPLTISIGPLHHGRDNLRAMEEYKLRYLLSLCERAPDAIKVLDDCAYATLDLEETVRDFYNERFELKKTDFARMLLVDGCFIIEIFFRYYTNDRRHDEPILLNPRMIATIRRDLALLENQIPFNVLDRLFKIIQNHIVRMDMLNLVDLACSFFELDRLHTKGENVFHLLDLIHNCYTPSSPSEHPIHRGTWKPIHSATKLSEAGIEFAGIEHEDDQKKSLFDLEFKKGVIKIPQLCIESSLFQNLIALEQHSHSHEHYMTSYGLLMDYLIDSSKDVEFLVKKNIISHNFGDYGQVADLFNNICKQSIVKGFYFARLCEQVDEHYKSKWHVYKKSLLRDYFGNPWMVTSIIVAFVLLVATVLQTVYSILSYYHS